LKSLGLVTVIVALVGMVFLGFYQCGGYIWIRQTVVAVVCVSFVFSLACSYLTFGHSLKMVVGASIILVSLLAIAWYSGQALYITPTSVSEFFGPGC
jgi:hypothetical protein